MTGNINVGNNINVMNAAGRKKRSNQNYVNNKNSTNFQEDFHERKKKAAKVSI